MRLDVGQTVQCHDGAFGELADVVIDPTKRRVTHLVVKPHDERDLARLVPIELVEASDDSSRIALGCTVEDVRRLDTVRESAYLRLAEHPVGDPDWDVGVENVLAIPYYEVASPGYDPGDYQVAGVGSYPGDSDPHVWVAYDRIPKGEVEIRRASDVVSVDGKSIGHVDGLLVDSEEQITHVVLERGHLWGKREVSIPIGAVASVETDAVKLNLSEHEVAALKDVPVRRW